MTTEVPNEDDDFIGSFSVYVQHGLLILRDVRSVDRHDGWDGAAPIHAGADSIYMRVQSSVDGPVTVEVLGNGSEDLESDDEVLLFDGAISSEHGEFVLHDPNSWISMAIVTDTPGAARLRITGDHDTMPASVTVRLWY